MVDKLVVVAGQSNADYLYQRTLTYAWTPHASVTPVYQDGTALCEQWLPGDPSGLLSSLTAAAQTPGRDYVAIVWVQGEGDAGIGRTTAQYLADFTSMKNTVEGGHTNILWIVAALADPDFVDITQILAAQHAICNTLPRCVYLETATFSKIPGEQHYNSAGLDAMWLSALPLIDNGIGQLYAASVGRSWPTPPDYYSPGRQPEPLEAYYQRYAYPPWAP